MDKLITTDGEILKEVGQIAYRGEDGQFFEKRPIYVKITPEEVNPKTQMLPQEEKAFTDVAKLFAEKFKQYVDGCKAQGIDLDI